MNGLRPNDQRAKTAIMLIWVVMCIEVISLGSSYMQYDLIQAAASGENISMDDANANDTRERMVGIVYMLAMIISGITFIQWFRRAYYNLHQRVNHLKHGEGWAAGAWFVPFLNWFRPYEIMKELYDETAEFLRTYEYKDKMQLSTSILGVWWAAWVIKSILGQVVFRLGLYAKDISTILSVTVMSMVQHVLGIVAAFLVIRIIKEYSAVEPLLMEYSYEDQINSIGSGSSDDDNTYEEF